MSMSIQIDGKIPNSEPEEPKLDIEQSAQDGEKPNFDPEEQPLQPSELEVGGDIQCKVTEIQQSDSVQNNIDDDAQNDPSESIIAFLEGFASLLDLGENLFTIFFYSTNFSRFIVFLTFVLVDFVKSFSDGCACCIVSPKFKSIWIICVEVGQCVLYIYFCDYVYPAKIFYPLILFFQCLPEFVKLSLKPALIDETQIQAEITSKCSASCSSSFTHFMMSAAALIYSFASYTSVYNSTWFQVYLTCYFWLGGYCLDAGFDDMVEQLKRKQEEQEKMEKMQARLQEKLKDVEANPENIMKAAKEVEAEMNVDSPSVDSAVPKLTWIQIVNLANAAIFILLTFSLGIWTLQHGPRTRYDRGLALFPICMFPIMMCCICCSLCLLLSVMQRR